MPDQSRRFSLASLLVVGLLVAACAGSTPSTASPSALASAPPSESADVVSLTVETIGGHCVQGACDSTITIDSDGTAHQVKPEPKELGTVPADVMDALVVEVEQADFEAIKSQPFTDACPIAFDGQQFVYTFAFGGQSERIDSCEVVVDPANPLFVAVDAVLASVAPS